MVISVTGRFPLPNRYQVTGRVYSLGEVRELHHQEQFGGLTTSVDEDDAVISF